jgi:hypothetical protein
VIEEADVLVRLPLEGAVARLAELIALHTGAPGLSAGRPDLFAALAGAFPRLGEPARIEGCTTHPALTVQLKIPGLNREMAKVVLVPRADGLEIRLRAEVPGGSYRKETLQKIVSNLQLLEMALKAGANPDE